MTNEQKNKCHAIIHASSVIDGAGNLSPIPATGFAADIVAFTSMTMALAAVFHKDLEKSTAKAIAIAALKKQILKQPMKTITKEATKVIPYGGQVISCAISVAIAEAAGWAIAYDLEQDKI